MSQQLKLGKLGSWALLGSTALVLTELCRTQFR